MATVQLWTGAETKALRQAMWLSIRAFAAHLGVDARSVNKWEARGRSITLRPDTQSLVDTAFGQASDDVKIRITQTMHSGGPQQHTNQIQTIEGLIRRTPIPADDVMHGAPRGSCDDMMRRELLRLLSMVAVLVTPGIADQPDRSSLNSGQLDHVSVNEYSMLNEHLWRVFALSKFKGTVLPLVRSQLEVLVANLDQSRSVLTHQCLWDWRVSYCNWRAKSSSMPTIIVTRSYTVTAHYRRS